MMVYPAFFPGRAWSRVHVQGFPEWIRFIVLVFNGWPTATLEAFENDLRCLLPVGSRWYGGYFKGVWSNHVQYYDRRWVQILVDFGGVDEDIWLDLSIGSLSLSGSHGAVKASWYDDGAGERCRCPKYKLNILGAFNDQMYIRENRGCVTTFGECLVLEECNLM